jgi:hypothetical protein
MIARLKVPIAILFLTFLAYARVIGYEFVYDDVGQIVENRNLQSWSEVPLYFTQHSWSHADSGGGTYYRPLFLVWLLLNRSLFGLAAWAWHTSALSLHLLCTLAVYFLARRLTASDAAAGFASLIFGLHPVHVEVVSWISGANESLMALLVLTSFLCFLHADESDRRRLYLAASLALYALAALAKETALILPLVVFAYRWIAAPADGESGLRRIRSAFEQSASYLFVTALYFAARVTAIGGFGQIHTVLSASTILLTWPSLIWFYVKHLILPVGLSAFYDTPYVMKATVSTVLLPGIFVAVAGALVLFVARQSSAMRSAAIILILPLLPVLNIAVFQEGDIAHDRYLYLSSVGLSIIVAVVLTRLQLGAPLLGLPAAQAVATASLVVLMIVGTAVQNQHWASNLLLYYRGIGIAPDSAVARNNLANEIFERGLHAEAIAMYREVLQKKPDFWLSNYNLGFSLLKLGHPDEAEAYFNRSIAINPSDADQYYYLGIAQMKLNRPEEAAINMRRATEIRAALTHS